MSDVIPFPEKPAPVFTDAMMDKLEGINDILRFDVVNSAVKEIKHLRTINQQYFDAITRVTQESVAVASCIYSAKRAMADNNPDAAKKYLDEALIAQKLPLRVPGTNLT